MMSAPRSRSSSVSKSGTTGQFAEQPLGSPAHEAGLTGKHIDDEQVGQALRHADDERADGVAPVSAQVALQDGVAGEHGVGLIADAGVVVKERTRRLEFLVQEFEAALLGPRCEVRRGLADGLEDLDERLIVKFAVLPDIERGEVETEDIECAAHGPHGGFGETFRADFEERFRKQGEIGIEFARGAVVVLQLPERRLVARADVDRELGLDEQDVLAPRLVGILAGNDFSLRGILRAEFRQGLVEDGGSF